MAEKIVLETEIKTGNSATSVKSVKTELRELKSAMAGLDSSSQEFVRMAQRAGQLEDAIGDANAAIKAFNPEAKLKAVADVVGVAANGFAAAQGAMAMFGGESKELEEIMVRTQGAIALATGINGLMGMGDAFTNLSNIIKTKVVTAFATMRSAIISTGILGLVVLIGTLVYAWMEEKEANEEATKELERFGEAQRKLLDQEQRIQIAREKGRKKEILQASAETQAKIREYQKELEEKKINLEEFNKLVKGEQELMRIAVSDIDKKYAEEEEKRLKDAAEKKKAADEKAKAEAKAAKEKADKEFTEQMYEQIDAQKEMNVMTAQMERQEFEDAMLRYDAIQKANKEAMALDKAKKDAQLNNLTQISGALGQFAQLADSHTIAAKGIAVATTTIDTYVAAQKAYTSQLVPGDVTSPVRGLFFAAAAVASGIANVRRILAVNKNSSPTPTPTSTTVPQFNPAVAQQVQGGGDVQLGMKPQKVYVVESDIRGTMNKVDVIQSNATIG